jgi:probable F420-dependent oxidoreductase
MVARGKVAMRIETSLESANWAKIGNRARLIEDLGYDRIASAELAHDPFLPLALAAGATERVGLVTSVAIAFPRSPMVTAYTARDLNDLSGGRFVLGLGTQVKGHIERRFATEWSSPGPRFRDYVQAVRAVWESWDSEGPLRYNGRFYRLSLMTPEFSPGPSSYGPIPIHIAGVNRYNLRLAGEICDGLRVHPFATKKYMLDVIWPAVRAGAERSGRDLAEFEMVGGGFIAAGANQSAVRDARENARYRIAFYASTRSYLPVLEAHGWEDLNAELRRLVAEGRWGDLALVIPDEVLDEFCVAGTYREILPAIRARYEGIVDTVSLDLPDDSQHAAYRELLGEVRALRPAGGMPDVP